jgi:hypothetical protein
VIRLKNVIEAMTANHKMEVNLFENELPVHFRIVLIEILG